MAQSPADIKYTLGKDFLDCVIDNVIVFYWVVLIVPKVQVDDVIETFEKMQITRVTKELVEGDKETAKKVHKYIYHPSNIKYLRSGELIYCCKYTK